MLYALHVLKMIRRILSSRYPYSRLSLLKSYFSLVIQSILHHWRGHVPAGQFHTNDVFGYRIGFRNHGQLLDMFEEIFILKAYEPMLRRNGGVIIDCGANIGLSVLYFRMTCPGADIVAFEPHQRAFDLLAENVKCNQLTGITLHPCALSDHKGTASLYGNEDYTLNMSLNRQYAGYPKTFEQETPVMRLSELLREKTFLVKIDVEGSESVIIEDLLGTNKLSTIQNLIIEYHYLEHLQYFTEQICSAGFSCQVRRKSEESKEALLTFWK